MSIHRPSRRPWCLSLATIAACTAPILIATVPAGAATSAPFTESFAWAKAGTPWNEGQSYGRWQDIYNGHGRVTRSNDPRLGSDLSLTPAVATSRSATHSALVISQTSFGNATTSLSVRTLGQLRKGTTPNPWEVGWVLWHYRDTRHFYYLLLKPNGWEFGKRDPGYPGGQRFLATGRTRFPVGSWNSVSIRQVGGAITVSANGHPLASRVDGQRPYLSGRLGLYTEDASAVFTRISVRSSG